MKIIQIVPADTWGGGERYVYDLSESIISKGHTISIAARKSDIIKDKFSRLGTVHTLPLKGLADLKSVIMLKRLIDEQGTEVIHTHIFKDSFTALFASKLSRRKPKVVMTRHLVKKGKDNCLYRWMYHNLNPLIFVSELAMNEFQGGLKVPMQNAVVVLNCIKTPTDIELRSEPNDIFTIGYVGRLDAEKGVDVLLNAVAKTDFDYRLLIAGNGAQKDALIALSEQLGLSEKVKFVGFIDNIFEFSNRLDVGVIPSIAREAMSLTLLEYISMGIPVISSNNGSQGEVVTNYIDGVLVESGNADQIAEALTVLKSDPNLMSAIKANALKTSKRFDYDTFVEKIISIYRN